MNDVWGISLRSIYEMFFFKFWFWLHGTLHLINNGKYAIIILNRKYLYCRSELSWMVYTQNFNFSLFIQGSMCVHIILMWNHLSQSGLYRIQNDIFYGRHVSWTPTLSFFSLGERDTYNKEKWRVRRSRQWPESWVDVTLNLRLCIFPCT